MDGFERFLLGILILLLVLLAGLLCFAQIAAICEAADGNWNPILGEGALIAGTATFAGLAWVLGGIFGDD
jgi:hypothetical protein